VGGWCVVCVCVCVCGVYMCGVCGVWFFVCGVGVWFVCVCVVCVWCVWFVCVCVCVWCVVCNFISLWSSNLLIFCNTVRYSKFFVNKLIEFYRTSSINFIPFNTMLLSYSPHKIVKLQ